MIELATAENFVPLIGDFVMDYTMNGRVHEQLGNTHPTLAPHNVYPCAGRDRWVAIVVRSDDQWRRFCSVCRIVELTDDPRFDSMAGRHEHRAALDALLEGWTSERDAYWVMERLQAAGVPAGVVMNERDVLENRHLAERGYWQSLTHPETGAQRYQTTPWMAGRTRVELRRAAPRLGEDNSYVYKELLGFTEEEYRAFEDAGHIGTDYDPSVP